MYSAHQRPFDIETEPSLSAGARRMRRLKPKVRRLCTAVFSSLRAFWQTLNFENRTTNKKVMIFSRYNTKKSSKYVKVLNEKEA